MLSRKYELLPTIMKNEAVKEYYEMLYEKRIALIFKRLFDIVFSFLLIILFSPVILVISLMIKFDSKGSVFFRQIRISKSLKEFKIVKFRTMYQHDDNNSSLTISSDSRITKAGKKLRKHRLDEIPQLFNILSGSMSFVGTRPEVPRYVSMYSDEMIATLLLPAGLTSTASILYRNEAEMLGKSDDFEAMYLKEILPSKMIYNLEYLRDYRFINDIKILIKTIFMN